MLFFLWQLNYQFLKKCVESAPVTPMQNDWFNNILAMIPEKLKSSKDLKETIQELFSEIGADFDRSMKKSMGMYTCTCVFILIYPDILAEFDILSSVHPVLWYRHMTVNNNVTVCVED